MTVIKIATPGPLIRWGNDLKKWRNAPENEWGNAVEKLTLQMGECY